MQYKKKDENGNIDETYVPYTGGAMKPSLAAEVGKQSGILSGETLYFGSYEDMLSHLSSTEWSSKHPGGTYIICSHLDNHASICTGVKNGVISIKSAQNGREKMDPTKHNYVGFTIVY